MRKYIKYLLFVKPKNIVLKNFWNLIFYFKYKNSGKDFKKIIDTNRETLTRLGELISENEYRKTDYGIPDKNFGIIDKQINQTPSNFDLITFLLQKIKHDSINYLEIGVSIMKNFMILDAFFENLNLVAYDINPIVAKNIEKFEKLSNDSNKLYVSNNTNNTLYYFQGDVLSDDDTSEFNKILTLKYDFIYSDALHTKEGIESEYENLIKNNLNEKFIIYYDDLDIKWGIPGVESAVFTIFDDMKVRIPKLKLFTFWINGWLGQNEKPHKNAIITNLDFESYLDDNNLKLPFLKSYM